MQQLGGTGLLLICFKLQLILFFEGLRSERQLIELASLNLAHRWYLGYHLSEPLPDHSSLSRIRSRLVLEIFRHFFEHMADLCQEAHLIWDKSGIGRRRSRTVLWETRAGTVHGHSSPTWRRPIPRRTLAAC